MQLFTKPIFFVYFVFALLGVLLVAYAGKKYTAYLLSKLFGSATYAKLTAPLRPITWMRTGLFCLFLFFLFTALAGPQWGTEIVEAHGEFAQAVIAVDVSTSMRAQDLKPNRLQNAKQMLQMLIENLKDERIGLIAFTSQAYIQSPITTDQQALDYFVSILQPDMLPEKGTSLAAPVELAAKMLAKYPGKKALILLTDGEDHEAKELEQAKKIAQQNSIRIIAIGIGTEQGSLIPVKMDNSGKVLEYKKDRSGTTVVSKLDEKTLLALAKATNGAFVSYTTPAQVAEQVEGALKGLDKVNMRVASHVRYKNGYAWPLTLALFCLAAYLLWPRGRKSSPKQQEKR